MNNALLDRMYVELPNGLGRNISPLVEVSHLPMPAITESQHSTWVDQLLSCNPLANPGDAYLSNVPPPPEFDAVLSAWAGRAGLADVPKHSPSRLLACDGSWFHHDADPVEYPESAFSILWLEDESQWDLIFPLIGMRIPLSKGMHVLFDSANIHGVVLRGTDTFNEEDFYDQGFQMFFSTAHQYSAAALRAKMGVDIRARDAWAGRASITGVCSDFNTFDATTGQVKV